MDSDDSQRKIMAFSLLTNGRADGVELDGALKFSGILEGKAGVLLSHISIMTAVAAIAFSVSSVGSPERILLAVEIIGYLILAIACVWIQGGVRASSIVSSFASTGVNFQNIHPQHIDAAAQKIIEATILKEQIFQVVQVSLYVLTSALVITIIVTIS